METVQQAVEPAQPTREVAVLDARLDTGEKVVDALVICMLRRAEARLEPGVAPRGDEGDRQVTVDVSIHARQGDWRAIPRAERASNSGLHAGGASFGLCW